MVSFETEKKREKKEEKKKQSPSQTRHICATCTAQEWR